MKNTNKKSNICIIANSLTKNGLNRSEAFRRAWAMAKGIDTKVSGVTFGKRQTALEHLTHYDSAIISVELTRDSSNQYDSNAVAVIVTVENKGSYTVGYLPKELSAVLAPVAEKVLKRHLKRFEANIKAIIITV